MAIEGESQEHNYVSFTYFDFYKVNMATQIVTNNVLTFRHSSILKRYYFRNYTSNVGASNTLCSCIMDIR